jgi:hypothetical protein
MARKKAPLDFEQSLAELQSLVERMESGALSLEDSLTAFEQGIGPEPGRAESADPARTQRRGA